MTSREHQSLTLLVGQIDGKLDGLIDSIEHHNQTQMALSMRTRELEKWRSNQSGYVKGFLAGFGVLAAAVGKLFFFPHQS